MEYDYSNPAQQTIVRMVVIPSTVENEEYVRPFPFSTVDGKKYLVTQARLAYSYSRHDGGAWILSGRGVTLYGYGIRKDGTVGKAYTEENVYNQNVMPEWLSDLVDAARPRGSVVLPFEARWS